MKSILLICAVIVSRVLICSCLSAQINLTTASLDPEHIVHSAEEKKWKPNLVPDDKSDHLMWFIQISDIHISIFHDPARVTDLRIFLTQTVDAIKPSVVLASGDLTDARDKDSIGSRQYEQEWRIYHDLVKSTRVESKTVWLDMRGNHDNFNVPLQMLDGTYYEQYSIQGKEHKKSYMRQIHGSSGDIYSFISVDACLPAGLKRPLNFVGMLTNNDTEYLRQLATLARNSGSNYTIWFGHYPTSCIATFGLGSNTLRHIISEFHEGLVYMCGHLHTLGDFVRNMYSMHLDGFLELEVADWKTSRVFRVAAIDHGIFSFIDTVHSNWPIVLITNPKHALYHLPHRNESEIQLGSTHIRILAFSPSGILNCTVQIDNQYFDQCKNVTETLFVLPWNPQLYADGVHTITVIVYDQSGRVNKISQPFKLNDRHKLSFGFLSRLVLANDVRTVFQCVYFLMLFMITFPLIFFRIWHSLILGGTLNRNGMDWCRSIPGIRKYWILSTINRLFWPIIVYWLYLSVGPWAIAEVIDDHYGVIFVWGVYIDGIVMPGSFTYLYAAFQLLLCQFPLINIFAGCAEKRYLIYIGTPREKRIASIRSLPKFSQAPFFFILTVELLLSVFFGMAYGAVAFFIGPFRTWSVILNFLLWYMSRNVPDHCYKSAALVWRDTHHSVHRDSNDTMRL